MSPTQTVTVTHQQLARSHGSPKTNPVKKRGLSKDTLINDETTVLDTKSKQKQNVNLFYATPSVTEGPSRKKLIYTEALIPSKKLSPTKRVRNYRLGPVVGNAPVKCIQQFLARKENSDNFYIIKILTLKNDGETQTMDDIQGKSLLHTEHSLLDIAKQIDGVVHEHGLFRETTKEQFVTPSGEVIVKNVSRICLVLDCYMPHDFSPKYSKLTNMQQHVIKEKKLPESEALRIFYKVVQIVERLHKLNVVHRDLKLGNIILNRETGEITLSNFCLGKHLTSETVPLTDQRGSPAYISPDVISGKPYLGKPSDMWALGVVLYTMLYGQFPFYDQSPPELFRKITSGEFQFPPSSDVNVSEKTKKIISSLLVLDPSKRLTASQTLEDVKNVIQEEITLMSDSDDQVVPSFPTGAEKPKPQQDVLDKYTVFADNALSDLASLLVSKSLADSGSTDSQESDSSKNGKPNSNSDNFAITFGKCTIKMEELHTLHAMYLAHKLKEAASSGKLPKLLVPEDLLTTSSASNALIKGALTNNDSAQVPCCKLSDSSQITSKKRAKITPKRTLDKESGKLLKTNPIQTQAIGLIVNQ